MQDRIQDFPAMLRAALGDRLHPDAAGFTDMLAEDAVIEFPYAPPGLPTRLAGRDAVARHLARLGRLIAFDRIGPAAVTAAGSDVTVLEFEAAGHGLATEAWYEQRYISVIRTRDGHIVHYRDYWNPLAVLRALLGDAAIEALDAGALYGD